MSRRTRLVDPVRARLFDAAESGRVPDAVLRRAVRARTAQRLAELRAGTVEEHWTRRRELLARRAAGPVTLAVDDANRQHYELPAELFELMLGPRLKYSSALWPDGVAGLQEAEEAMLSLCSERARLEDGQSVLDLGCGWGSFWLWAAQRYPASRITAVSNSGSQRRFIEARAAALGLANVEVITADAGALELDGRFDRVVSIEFLEHVWNHRQLMRRLAGWLAPDGKVFVHVFSHRTEARAFDAEDDSDWIGRWFFTGGTMPSDDLLLHEQRDLVVVDHWRHSGVHYQRTLDSWLDRLDARRDEALAILRAAQPGVAVDEVERSLQRWRMFLMISAEVWGFRGGREFIVSHYLLAPRRPA